jgi:hypothetical protein
LNLRKTFRLLTSLAVSVVFFAVATSCHEAASETPVQAQTGAALSGPATTDASYGGARNPRKCLAMKHVPSALEAGALAQCYSEKKTSNQMYLWQNVQVQMGSARAYAYESDSRNEAIDTTAKVYPIRVTADRYVCTGDSTCSVQHTSDGPGTCTKTTLGDWSCSFSQVYGLESNTTKKPVPTGY